MFEFCATADDDGGDADDNAYDNTNLILNTIIMAH